MTRPLQLRHMDLLGQRNFLEGEIARHRALLQRLEMEREGVVARLADVEAELNTQRANGYVGQVVIGHA